MQNKMIIYGAGGLGKEILAVIEDEYNVLGFVDDHAIGIVIGKYNVLGNTEWLLKQNEKLNVVICVANSLIRKKIVEKLSLKENFIYPNIIAKSVKTSKYNELGKGCIICDDVIMTVKVNVEDFCIIDYDSTIGHESHLNKFVTLYPSVNISGNVEISECTEIGTGSNVIQQLKIGKNVVIGAGAVVVRDIPDNCTAVGVPAKPIKFR